MTDATSVPEGLEGGQLREWAERVARENTQLRTQLVDGQLREIGLDPETGLGKAIRKEFREPVTEGAVATYASEEYGYTFTPPPPAPAGEAEPEAEPSGRAAELRATAEGMDAVIGASSSAPEPVSLADQLAAFNARAAAGQATREDAIATLNAKVDQT